MKAALVHLAEGVRLAPALDDHAVQGDDRVRPVGAVLAVDDERPIGGIRQDSKGFDDPAVAEAEGGHGYVEELQVGPPGSRGVSLSPRDVQDRLDPEGRQLPEPGARGPGAAMAVRIEPGAEHHGILASLCDRLRLRGNDINDAYLAALALEHAATLVTADQNFKRFSDFSLVDPVAGSSP